CFEWSVGNTPQEVRWAYGSREAGQGHPAPLQGAHVSCAEPRACPWVPLGVFQSTGCPRGEPQENVKGAICCASHLEGISGYV
ncbi:hypothetical protein EAH_00068650, partial [Eimeria acervulina]